MAAGHRRVDIEEVSDVTVAKFIDKKILDEGNIQIIGTQLFGLVDEDGRKKIILDFSNVEYLSSAALGKLITLDKKVKKAKGKLKLCSIRPDIYEVFAITRLNQLLISQRLKRRLSKAFNPGLASCFVKVDEIPLLILNHSP